MSSEYATLSDEFKYPKGPLDKKVDRLEDRIARQEANLNMPIVEDYYQEDYYQSNIQSSNIPQIERAEMTYVKKTDRVEEESKVLVAADYKQYIGEIVNYDGTKYVEVVGVVENLVAIKVSPYGTPELVSASWLTLF